MKKSLLLAGSFLLTTTIMNAQVQRLCLAEGFSNASCPPCASQNPAYNTLLGNNTTKVVGIKYQTNWPGTDPMNAQTQSQVATRVTYYNVTGVPNVEFDGNVYSGSLTGLTQTAINNRYAVSSPFNLTVSHSFNACRDSIFITVTVNTPVSYSGSNLKLHVNMIEETITFSSAPGTNGETVFHGVFRDSYTTTAGQDIQNTWTTAETQVYNFADKIPAYIYDYEEIGVVAFIQNNTSKEVHQTGVSHPIAINLNDFAKLQNIGNINPLNCTGDVNGATVQIKNTGNNTITSATVNYQVDAGTPSSTPWTGTLNVGGTTNVTIPNISGVTNGIHTLTAWLTNINGSGACEIGLTDKDFTIVSVNGTGSSVTQNFSAGTIPYTNWVLDAPNESYYWRRVTNAGGVALFQSYSYPNGATSSMILEPIDMTAFTGNVNLTFDVAYRQYSAENDRLQVDISTDCGGTWTNVYNKAGSTLATLAPSTTQFIPTTAPSSDWRNEVIDLSSYSSSNKLFVRFKATSNYGNNMFIDNININSTTVGIEETETVTMNLYPNPTSDVLNLNLNLMNASDVNLSIVNNLGQTVMVRNLGNLNGNTTSTFDVSSLASGIYNVNIFVNGELTVKPFVKK